MMLLRTSRKCVCVSCKQSVCGFIKKVKIFPEREREKIRGRVKTRALIETLMLVLFLVCYSFILSRSKASKSTTEGGWNKISYEPTCRILCLEWPRLPRMKSKTFK